ncbi:MAG: DUF4388 domain-containing protein [Nitrospirota bacterium]
MGDIIKGNLSDNPLSDLLTSLQVGGATGTLQIACGSQFKKILIMNGDIVFASSDAGDEQLGEVVIKKGEITLEEYNQSMLLSAQKGESMEKALLQLGYMTPEELLSAVKYQVEEIILDLFALREGRFEFYDALLSGDEQKGFCFRAADLIYKGIMRIDSFTCLKQLCPRIDDVLNFSSTPGVVFKDVVLDDIDKKILSFVNGLYSVKVILLFSPLNDFGTLRRLCAFLGAGLVKIKSSDEEASEPPEDLVSSAPEKTSAQSIEKIEEMCIKCDALNFYEILDIEMDASAEDIRAAYCDISKSFHPDRYSKDTAIKEKLNRILFCTTESYETLSDREKRKAYDRTISPEEYIHDEADSGPSALPQEQETGQPEETVNESESEHYPENGQSPDKGGSNMKPEPGVDREETIAGEDKEPAQKKIMYIPFIVIALIILVVSFTVFKKYKEEPESPGPAVSKKMVPLPHFRDDLFEKIEKDSLP